MKNQFRWFAGSSLLLLASFTHAASVSVDFDLTGSGPDVDELVLTEGGIDLTISADTISNAGALEGRPNAQITRSGSGIGVDNGVCLFRNFFCDNDNVDGFGLNDIALFAFSREVTIESFSFTGVDFNDGFRLFAGSPLNQIGDFNLLGNGAFTFSTVAAALLTGDSFGVGAFDFILPDNFRISGVSVSYDAVPIPAALPLMLTGVLGLGFLGRRKKRQAALTAASS